MSFITWKSIKADGAWEMNDAHPTRYEPFDMPNVHEAGAALLIIAAKNVGSEKNFITLHGEQITSAGLEFLRDASYDDARESDSFVSRIFSTGSTYTTQVHRIGAGQLRDGRNHLGIHARSSSGAATPGSYDDFELARVFLVYTAT